MTPFFYERLADYFRAVAALDGAGDEQKQRAIAEMLGLIEPPPAPAPAATKVDDRAGKAAGKAEKESTKTRPGEGGSRAASAPPPAPHPRRHKPVRFTIDVTSSTPAGHGLDWLEDPGLLEAPRSGAPRIARPAPLLRPRWARAVLSTAMATTTEINQVDIAAVLDAEVQGRILRRIPRRVVPSLSRGVQVLVDGGPSSEPFRDDQQVLIEQIRSVGGRDTVSVVQLDSSRELEASAGDDEGDYFEKFRAPAGVVVVLVSDLGMIRVPFEETALPSDWMRFISRLRAGGNPVIAFVPLAPGRWPQELARPLAMVQWDRTTTVQEVRRAIRRTAR